MSIAKPFTFVANTHAKASEVNANFDTVYSQVNTNISNIAQNATDIDNLENNKADVNGSASQRFAVADAVTSSDAINKSYLMNAIGNSIDIISGLIITKDSGSPNDTIIVSEGSCYDSTHGVVLSLNNSLSKQNLNQGANSTYYVYIIGNSSASQTDVLISVEQVTPALPTGYSLYRLIGSYTTNSNGDIFKIISNSQQTIKNTFSSSSKSLTANTTTDLSSYLPNDGNIYLVWVYNHLDSGDDLYTTVETDIFPSTRINRVDVDSGRRSQSDACCAVPVGNGRTIKVNRSSSLVGYMMMGVQ